MIGEVPPQVGWVDLVIEIGRPVIVFSSFDRESSAAHVTALRNKKGVALSGHPLCPIPITYQSRLVVNSG